VKTKLFLCVIYLFTFSLRLRFSFFEGGWKAIMITQKWAVVSISALICGLCFAGAVTAGECIFCVAGTYQDGSGPPLQHGSSFDDQRIVDVFSWNE
jgi:hypothetical protein